MESAATSNAIPHISEDPANHEDLFESFASISSISKAWARPIPGAKSMDIIVSLSQRNLTANSIRKYTSTAFIPDPLGDLTTFHWSPFPFETSSASLTSYSPSGARSIIVKNPGKDENGPTKFEVWSAGRLVREIFVDKALHGPVYSDGWFEGLSWNADETKLVYVAEEPPKPKPVFGSSKGSDAKLSAQYGKPARGAKPEIQSAAAPSQAEPGSWKGYGERVEDWGEGYTGKGRPLLFVLDIEKGTSSAVAGIPANISAGQAVWSPDQSATGSWLVFVGWASEGTNFGTSAKLGIIYCFNRPCSLYAVKVPQSPGQQEAGSAAIVNLTEGLSSAFCPRFSPDGSTLAFLSAESAVTSGAHNATNSLHTILWPADGLSLAPPRFNGSSSLYSGETAAVQSAGLPIKTVVAVVPRAEELGGFPGLYCTSLAEKPWLLDSKTLVLTTAWRSASSIVAVNVDTGRVSRLTPEGPISWNLLCLSNNVIVAGASTPACPTKLMLGRLNAGWLKTDGWLWTEISPPHVEYPVKVEDALKSTDFEVIQVPVVAKGQDLSPGALQPFEAILIRRQSDPEPAPAPLVVVPHGGPHGVTVTSFSLPYAFLAAAGYSVLHVNYRGSLGFGEEALQSLPRNIGRQDVADVLAAVDATLALGLAVPDRVAVVGGSHGGFLAAHLIGQVPDRFRTAVLRNPVCDLPSMLGTSDIPDWCFVEGLGTAGLAGYKDAPDVNDLQTLHRVSPMAHVDKVKVPTLLLLGGADRRVPPFNGLMFARALKTQGVETKVLFFPEDSHALDKPQTEFEQWVTIVDWLKTHL